MSLIRLVGMRLRKIFRQNLARTLSEDVLPHYSILDLNGVDALARHFYRPSQLISIDPESSQLVDEGLIARGSGAPYDYLIANFWLEKSHDIQNDLEVLRRCSSIESRLIVVSYNRLWWPVIQVLHKVGLKKQSSRSNYLSPRMIASFLSLTGFEICKSRPAMPLPITPNNRFFEGLNRVLARVPLVNQISAISIIVARKIERPRATREGGVSILVPARNEEGHIRELLTRLPRVSENQEVIFIEGGSQDGTWSAILEQVEGANARRSGHIGLKALQQQGTGKADAVRLGIRESRFQTLVILDADLSVPPEDLPKFVGAIWSGRAEFVNGTRMVYDMEAGAMRFLNLLGNRLFAILVGNMAGYSLSDALCGTKCFLRSDYFRASKWNESVAERDPFGDFELIFSASRLGLSIREIPVRYAARIYGETNISRFRDGYRLVRVLFGQVKNQRLPNVT